MEEEVEEEVDGIQRTCIVRDRRGCDVLNFLRSAARVPSHPKKKKKKLNKKNNHSLPLHLYPS